MSGSDTAPVVTSTGTLDAFDREIFRVEAVFAGVPQLAVGTYWLSVHDGAWGSGSDGSIMGWTFSLPAQKDGLAFETDLADPKSWVPVSDLDTAMELRGVAVHEPSSLALAGLGSLGLVVGFGWRRLQPRRP